MNRKKVVISGREFLCKVIDIEKYIRNNKKLYHTDGMNGFDFRELCEDVAYDDLKADYYDYNNKIGYFIV